VRRLEGLLSEMRDYYTPREMNCEPVDILQVFKEILDPLSEEFKSRGIEVETSIAEDVKWVEGDPRKLKQVFLNLVKNAMEAMKDGGAIRVSASPSDDLVEIKVADEGHGISEKDKDKLFTPFFTTKSKGTGLGLCVVKRIVEQHKNGSISLESEEGRGTVFTVRLPRSSMTGMF